MIKLTRPEPIMKLKMRLLVRQGMEGAFDRLFDELIEQREVIYTESKMLTESSEARCNAFISFIEDLFCTHFGVENASIYKVTRKREIMSTRQVVMWAIKNTYDLGLSNIGRRYGKDHATVLHACKQVNGRLATERIFREVITHSIEQIKESGFEAEALALDYHVNEIKTLFK